MNSLWRNLSSSHTEILPTGGESGKSQRGQEEPLEAAGELQKAAGAAGDGLPSKDSTSDSHLANKLLTN